MAFFQPFFFKSRSNQSSPIAFRCYISLVIFNLKQYAWLKNIFFAFHDSDHLEFRPVIGQNVAAFDHWLMVRLDLNIFSSDVCSSPYSPPGGIQYQFILWLMPLYSVTWLRCWIKWRNVAKGSGPWTLLLACFHSAFTLGQIHNISDYTFPPQVPLGETGSYQSWDYFKQIIFYCKTFKHIQK